jgi:hypothetical protein
MLQYTTPTRVGDADLAELAELAEEQAIEQSLTGLINMAEGSVTEAPFRWIGLVELGYSLDDGTPHSWEAALVLEDSQGFRIVTLHHQLDDAEAAFEIETEVDRRLLEEQEDFENDGI